MNPHHGKVPMFGLETIIRSSILDWKPPSACEMDEMMRFKVSMKNSDALRLSQPPLLGAGPVCWKTVLFILLSARIQGPTPWHPCLHIPNQILLATIQIRSCSCVINNAKKTTQLIWHGFRANPQFQRFIPSTEFSNGPLLAKLGFTHLTRFFLSHLIAPTVLRVATDLRPAFLEMASKTFCELKKCAILRQGALRDL